jgi:predicted transglutaminase-like cysteine proteinase
MAMVWRQRLSCLLTPVWAAFLLGSTAGDVPAEAVPPSTVPLIVGEVRSADLRPFPKWLGMLARHAESHGRIVGPCTQSQFGDCGADVWYRTLESLRGRDAAEQVVAVNTMMNRARYVADMANWGVPDYWETPTEFFARDGDCEDYAIAKFASLRALGVPNEAMRIVVVQDMNLKIPHAVLAVYANHIWLLLDNQISQVVEMRRVNHYQPIFSLNETSWWLHRR